jgi:integrase
MRRWDYRATARWGSPSPASTYAMSLPRTRRRRFWYGNAAEIMLASPVLTSPLTARSILPPKVVQRLLGHSSIVMTLDVYGHLLKDGGDRAELAEASRLLLG